MVLSEQQIQLVQACYRQIEEHPQQFTDFFYNKLFELDPNMQVLFRNDMAIQGRKLVSMLEIAAYGMSDLDMLVPMLRQLAERHNDYGVKKAHFEMLSDALHYALEQHLGEAYSDEHRQAWQQLLDFIISIMKPEIKEC